ncbi:MAG: LamB/YcsF family protein [Rudaea sp.]
MDLNSDLGESFGTYTLGNDAGLMPLITSANIACGFHAGDPQVMDRTVGLAKQFGVAVGAHPGYPDLAGFGRRKIDATENEIEDFVLYQVAALAGFARAHGVSLRHVKPHGALYNVAATNLAVARAIAQGIARFDPTLILVGLANSALVQAAGQAGLRAAREGFADRSYSPDGTLRSRREPGAVHATAELAAQQALDLARDRRVTAFDGSVIALEVDTICLHGDTPNAVEYARAVRQALTGAGIKVQPL